jgi:hypothetical protein
LKNIKADAKQKIAFAFAAIKCFPHSFSFFFFFCLITDNKSLNHTDSSNQKPKVWVETGQMHQRADNIVDHNENTIPDDNNEVGEAFG